MFVHCCNMYVTDPHCSRIGAGSMALRVRGIGRPNLKWFRSAVVLQNGPDVLKRANGFKTVQVSNRSINIYMYVHVYV